MSTTNRMNGRVLDILKATIPPRLRPIIKRTAGFPVAQNSDYEVYTQEALRRLLRPGDIAFDVGANVGILSVVLSRLVGPTGRVYAFDANPSCISVLHRTLRLNRVGNCTTTLAAVCDRHNEHITVYSDERSDMHWVASSVTRGWEGLDSPRREFRVPAMRLDEFCDRVGAAPRLLKIDVEGAELEVLRGFQRYLEPVTVDVLLEVRSDGSGAYGPLNLLEDLGYRVAIPRPWRWTTAQDFASRRGAEEVAVAVNPNRIPALETWVSQSCGR